jgi:hypothetical protein
MALGFSSFKFLLSSSFSSFLLPSIKLSGETGKCYKLILLSIFWNFIADLPTKPAVHYPPPYAEYELSSLFGVFFALLSIL